MKVFPKSYWLEVKFFIFQLFVSNSKWNSVLFNFELITWSKLFIFQHRVNNVDKWKFNIRVSNLKWNLVFHKVELVTREKSFCKNFRVSKLRCDVIDLHILCNSRTPSLSFTTSRFLSAIFVNFWQLIVLVNTVSSAIDNTLKELYLGGNNNKNWQNFAPAKWY